MTAHHLGLVSMLFSKRYSLSHVLLTPCRAPCCCCSVTPPLPCPTQPNARSDNKPVSGSALLNVHLCDVSAQTDRTHRALADPRLQLDRRSSPLTFLISYLWCPELCCKQAPRLCKKLLKQARPIGQVSLKSDLLPEPLRFRLENQPRFHLENTPPQPV